MRDWLSKWFRVRRVVPPLPAVPLVPEWTEDDAAILLTFFSNPTGSKLMFRARSLEARNAVQACRDSVTSTHSAGRAAGFSDAINWICSLTISSPVSDVIGTEYEAADGETRNLEMTSP